MIEVKFNNNLSLSDSKVQVMPITYKSVLSGNSIYNIPSPPDSTGPQPGDLKVTSATSTSVEGQLSFDGDVLAVKLQGDFQYPKGTPKTGLDLFNNTIFTATKFEIYLNGTLIEQTIFSPAVDGATFFKADTDLEAARTVYSGNDTFVGAISATKTSDSDTLDGFAGNDTFYGNGSGKYDDIFYGGSGIDTSVYRGKYANYTITKGTIWNDYTSKSDLAGFYVTDKTGLDGKQQLNSIERLQFTDGTLALDFARGENGYKAAMMIGAAFGKQKISEYFAPAVQLFDQGMSSDDVAKLVIDLKLIENAIGSNTNKAFVDAVYKNVVGVLPDALSQALYTNYLDTGTMSKAQLLALAAGVDLLENQINLTGLQSTGTFYAAFV